MDLAGGPVNFQLAHQWATNALEMTKSEMDKAEIRARLEVYKQNKPYREELMKPSIQEWLNQEPRPTPSSPRTQPSD